MGQRILVFEKNTDFVQELKTGFGKYGAALDVVRDADAGIKRAKADSPDLVLLSVDAMSAASEAFLVCKRFKSDDDLSKIPFVIMGQASHADSFESHKKLKRRRAEEYVQLPVSFDELLVKLQPFVTLEPDNSVDDFSTGVDADIDAFADSAFDDLVRDEAVAPRAEPEPVDFEPPAVAEPLAALPEEPVQSPVADGGLEEELRRLRDQVEELASRATSAEQRATSAEQRASSAEQRMKAAESAKPSSVTSSTGLNREHLELREQLNKKDRELLALRDEIAVRDRKLIEQDDRTLELERSFSDARENVEALQLERQTARDLQRQAEQEAAAAQKRVEELSAQLKSAEELARTAQQEAKAAEERSAEQLAARTEEFEGRSRELEEKLAADSARLRADHAAKLEVAQAEAARALEELGATHQNELSALRAAQEQALAQAGDEQVEAVAQERERGQRELSAELERLAQEHVRALEAAADERERHLAEAEQAQNSALSALRAELLAGHEGQLREHDEKHEKELALLGRKLNQADEQVAELNENLQSVRQDLATRTEERDLTNNELTSARGRVSELEQAEAALTQRVSELEGQLLDAQRRIEAQASKMSADGELLDRVRTALGISVTLLEQQRQGS